MWCLDSAQDYFCELLAPGQGEKIKKRFVQPESTTVKEKVIPPEVEHLVQPFKQASSQQAGLIILTLVPDHVSKSQMMEYFSCSKYMVEKARSLKSTDGAGCPVMSKGPYT